MTAPMTNQYATEAEIAEAGVKLGRLRDVLNTVLFGQERLIDHVITGLLARGHSAGGVAGAGEDGAGEGAGAGGAAGGERTSSRRIFCRGISRGIRF